MSRVALIVCGAALLAAVAAPMATITTSDVGSSMDDLAAKDAGILDRFWNSDLDYLVVRGSDLLPGPEYSVTVKGKTLTMSGGEGVTHAAGLAHPGEFTMGYDDVLRIVRGAQGFEAAGLRSSPRSCGGRSQNGLCPRRCCRGRPRRGRPRRRRSRRSTGGRSASPSGS